VELRVSTPPATAFVSEFWRNARPAKARGHADDDTPDGIQHLLRKAVWDAEEVRDDLRE